MARIGIEEKDVHRAADEIVETGQEATLQAVREKLGTGSFATISTHLKKWREQKLRQTPVPDLPDGLTTAMRQIWSLAYREATSLFDAGRAAWDNERKKLAEETASLLAEIQKLEHAISQEQFQHKETTAKLDEQIKRHQNLDVNLRDTREKLIAAQSKLEANAERLKEEIVRADRLQNELANIAKRTK